MKLEQQVVSLELSKKLKELGVKQESFAKWEVAFGGEIIKLIYPNLCTCTHFDTQDVREYHSAFTVAELGEMLPERYVSYRVGDKPRMWSCKHPLQADPKDPMYQGNTEANARAKMFIYLLEKNLT